MIKSSSSSGSGHCDVRHSKLEVASGSVESESNPAGRNPVKLRTVRYRGDNKVANTGFMLFHGYGTRARKSK